MSRIHYLYALHVKGTDTKYIGQTTNTLKREKRHKGDLVAGRHHSIYLQRYSSKNELTPDDVSLIVITSFETKRECDEQEELEIGTNYENLFNVSKNSSGGDLVSYHPRRDEIAEKHREAYIKRMEEGMIPPGVKWGEDNPNYRHGNQTKEAVRKAMCCECGTIKVARVGALCKICLRNMQSRTRQGEDNNFFGKSHSAETRQKLSELNTGRFLGDKHPQSKKIVAEGVIYLCAKDCAEKYGISRSLVTYRLNSHKWDYSIYSEDIHSGLEIYNKEEVNRNYGKDSVQC